MCTAGTAMATPGRAAPLMGAAQAWGYDLYDQAGVGLPLNQSPLGIPVPTAANGQTGVSGVAAGGSHSLVLESGHLFGWGRDHEGQLGDGSSGSTAQQVSKAVEAQTAAGSPLSGVTAVEAGTNHTLALTSGGGVYAMGSNNHGQLGNGTTTDSAYAVPVMESSTTALSNITAIAAGGFHSLALDSTGNVWSWGDNTSGQIGDGTIIDRLFAVKLTGLPTSGHTVTDIAAGHDHTLAVQSDGTVWAWGSDASGQLGDGVTGTGTSTPQNVRDAGGANLTIGTSVGLAWPLHRLGGGESHSLALKSDGTVLAWGGNAHGQLGTASTSNPLEAAPTQNLTGVRSISAGGIHSLSLQSDGTMRSWGFDLWGQLGDGTFGDPTPTVATDPTSGCFCRTAPAVVIGIAQGLAISAGGGHSLATMG